MTVEKFKALGIKILDIVFYAFVCVIVLVWLALVLYVVFAPIAYLIYLYPVILAAIPPIGCLMAVIIYMSKTKG
jgi:hypothetical protein